MNLKNQFEKITNPDMQDNSNSVVKLTHNTGHLYEHSLLVLHQ